MKSLRSRLTCGLLAVLLFVTGCGFAALYGVLRHEALESFDTALRARAQSLASMADVEHGVLKFEFPAELTIAKGKRPVRYAYFDETGKILAQSASPPPPVVTGLVAASVTKPAVADVGLGHDHEGRGAYCEFLPGDAVMRAERPSYAGRLRLWVVEDRHELDETLDRLLGVVIGAGALMALAVALLVPRIVSRGLRPLERLARRAGEIDANALSERFPEDGLPDELRAIVGKLNGLLARLEISFEREKRFSADISHELRTPVAELKSLAECARKWPDMRTEQAADDMLGVIVGMENLITQMLALAACENGVTAIRSGPVASGALVREAVAPFRSKAESRSLTLRLPEDDAPEIVADPTLLKAVITNLLDNAVAYAPEGSEIVVTMEIRDDTVILVVANAAPELDAHDVARLFDGFWRKDPSRTERHAGLGLTLAQSFARAMGMTLAAELDAGVLKFSLHARRPGRTE